MYNNPIETSRAIQQFAKWQQWLSDRKVLLSVTPSQVDWYRHIVTWAEDENRCPYLLATTDDQVILRVSYKPECPLNARYWLTLTIGELSLTNLEDTIDIATIAQAMATLSEVSLYAAKGSLGLLAQSTGELSIVYNAPIPWAARLTRGRFLRFLKSVKVDACVTLKDHMRQFVDDLMDEEARFKEFVIEDDENPDSDIDTNKQPS